MNPPAAAPATSTPAPPAPRGEAREPGPAGRRAARRELALALVDLLPLPLRLFDYWLERPERERRMREDLAGFLPAPRGACVERGDLPARPLRIVLSCAEASGEIHAANLARELRRRCLALGLPEPELVGLGGERLAAAGVRVVLDTLSRATMGIGGALRALPYYLDLVGRVHDVLAETAADLFLPVDSPALHVPLGRVARRLGVPVVHFVTPQYWGWAPWRVRRYASAIDHALTILPFEPAWFERHGVPSTYVGHPLVDALRDVPSTRPDARSRTLVLLPGSRASVIDRNLPWMLDLVDGVRGELGEVSVEVLQEDGRHRERIEALLVGREASLAVGDLHGHLARARSALSVSGTVLVDLLHHRLPTVVLYRLGGRLETWMARHLLTTPWFASPNLLAGQEVLPEFCFAGDGPREAVGRALVRCHVDAAWRRACAAGLERATRRLGPPGAVERAASHALAAVAAGNR